MIPIGYVSYCINTMPSVVCFLLVSVFLSIYYILTGTCTLLLLGILRGYYYTGLGYTL